MLFTGSLFFSVYILIVCLTEYLNRSNTTKYVHAAEMGRDNS